MIATPEQLLEMVEAFAGRMREQLEAGATHMEIGLPGPDGDCALTLKFNESGEFVKVTGEKKVPLADWLEARRAALVRKDQ